MIKSVWGYTRHDYYLVKVVRRTKTRIFTVFKQHDHEHEEAWTLDGSPYPRPDRYGGRRNLMPCTAVNLETHARNKAVRRVEAKSYELAELVRKSSWDIPLAEMGLRNLADVLETYILQLKPKEEEES